MYKKRALIDFDCTLHEYSQGWLDGSIYDPPINGAKEAMELLGYHNIHRIIWSTRCYDRMTSKGLYVNQIPEMLSWMNKYKIPYDEFCTEPGKPLAHIIVDDRAIWFDGDWGRTAEKIIQILQEEN